MKAFNIVLSLVGLVCVLLGIFVIKEDQMILLGCAIIVISMGIYGFRRKK